MKKWLFPLFPLWITTVAAQSFEWAKQLGGVSADRGYDIAVDANGYVYTTGSFMKTSDFDPGSGTYFMTSGSGGIDDDAFVCKLDSNGSLVWAKQLGKGTSNVRGLAIAIDAGGNVYTTGEFEETNDFDPGPGIYNMTSMNATYDIFISKLDANGNFLWAKQIGGPTSWDAGYGIAVDNSGNVYSTGQFYGTVDFDPGTGTYNMTSAGGWDVFISKLDASGNFIWARQLGGSLHDIAEDLTIAQNGDVYTIGRFFSSPADFDPGSGTYNMSTSGNWDVFISKLDSSGNFIWARQLGGADNDVGNNIAIGSNGNVYTTGCFTGTADFDPGTGIYNMISHTSNRWDIFVSKLDASGSFVWASQLGGKERNESWGIAVDTSSNVYTTGLFLDTADFDPGMGVYNLVPGASYDVFISKLDASGSFVWAKQLKEMAGGPPPQVDWGCDIVVNQDGSTIHTVGYFRNTLDFDPDAGVYNMSSFGNTDAFVLKLNDLILPIELLYFNAVPYGDLVRIEWATAAEINNDFFTIEVSSDPSDGRELKWKALGTVDAAGNSEIIHRYCFMDLSPHKSTSKQILYYRLKQTDYNGKSTNSNIVKVELKEKGDNDHFVIYPNPAKGAFTINGKYPVPAELKIFNLMGLRVKSAVIKDTNESIDVGSLSHGLYIWQLGDVKGKLQIE